MPVGYQPDVFRRSTSGEGTFQVTDQAAYRRTESYKCIDRKELARSFHPVIQLTPRGLDQGPVTLSFAVMLHARPPAPLNVEFRGAGGTSETGPSLRFQADGDILAGSDQLLHAPPGTWTI